MVRPIVVVPPLELGLLLRHAGVAHDGHDPVGLDHDRWHRVQAELPMQVVAIPHVVPLSDHETDSDELLVQQHLLTTVAGTCRACWPARRCESAFTHEASGGTRTAGGGIGSRRSDFSTEATYCLATPIEPPPVWTTTSDGSSRTSRPSIVRPFFNVTTTTSTVAVVASDSCVRARKRRPGTAAGAAGSGAGEAAVAGGDSDGEAWRCPPGHPKKITAPTTTRRSRQQPAPWPGVWTIPTDGDLHSGHRAETSWPLGCHVWPQEWQQFCGRDAMAPM